MYFSIELAIAMKHLLIEHESLQIDICVHKLQKLMKNWLNF